jgi:hypothetical protein
MVPDRDVLVASLLAMSIIKEGAAPAVAIDAFESLLKRFRSIDREQQMRDAPSMARAAVD